MVALALSASCAREGTLYEIPDGNPCVSFPAGTAMFEMVAADGNKFTIELWRGNTKGSVSVPVTIEGGEGAFTPSKSSFDFADGQAKATIDFNYPDLGAFGGEVYTIKVSVNDLNMVSPSGYDEVTIQAQRKLTPKYLGTGIYYSDWYEAEWEQDIYTTEEAPNYYILPNCWVTGTDFTFTMENGQPVWPASFFSGYVHSSYGNVYIYSGDSYIEDGVLYLEVSGYRVSAGSFGSGIEYFVLPEGMKL
jgi:hypothetical protein